MRWAGLITKNFDMKTELNKNEKLSTEQETPPIANVLLAAVNSLRSKHDAWIGNQTDQITSANAKGFKEGLSWAISTIEHYIELEHFQEQYNREEAERIALQNRYVYDEGGNCDGFAR